MDLIPLADPARIKTKQRDDPSADTGMAGALAAFLSVLGDTAGAAPTPGSDPQLTEIRERTAGASGSPVPPLNASTQPVSDAGSVSAATMGVAVAADISVESGRPPAKSIGTDAAAIDMATTPPAIGTATTDAPQRTFIDQSATPPEASIQFPLAYATQTPARAASGNVSAASKPDWTIAPDRHDARADPLATSAGEPIGDRPRPPETASPQAANPITPSHDTPRADHAQASPPKDWGVPGSPGLTTTSVEMVGRSKVDTRDLTPPGHRPVVVPATSAAPDSMAAMHRSFVTSETPSDGPVIRQDLSVIPKARPETARAAGVPAGMLPRQIPALGAGGATDAPYLEATVVPGDDGVLPVVAPSPETRLTPAMQAPPQPNDTASEIRSESDEIPVVTGDPVASPADGPSLQRGLDRAAANHSAPGPLPAGLGHRLAEAVSQFPDRPVEITLSPEELGRVRLTLATHDGALTMMVQADRSDTLDLLRRNIDSLAQDFRDLGFQDVTFSFGQERDPRQPPAPKGRIAFSEPDPVQGAADTTADDRPRHSAAGGGLDLRL